jgi:hypothetical protein
MFCSLYFTLYAWLNVETEGEDNVQKLSCYCKIVNTRTVYGILKLRCVVSSSAPFLVQV